MKLTKSTLMSFMKLPKFILMSSVVYIYVLHETVTVYCIFLSFRAYFYELHETAFVYCIFKSSMKLLYPCLSL